MVSSGQVFNIALILVGGYVVITYGPQIITAIKKSIDDMKTAAGAGTPATTGGDTSTAPATGGDTTIPPFPDPGMTDQTGQTAIPDPQYAPPASQQDYINAPTKGADPFIPAASFFLAPPPSTANSTIDPSGLIQQHPTVSSPQNPVNKKKNSNKKTTTITKQQKQQEHLQNSTTSTGAPVPPPHVQVSQAHPSPAKVSTPANTGHGIQSRFRLGTAARDTMDYQLGCNCVGKTCCFRGRKCDQSMGAECSKTSNMAHCNSTLRSQFLAKNPCNKPTSGPAKSKYPPITPASWPDPSKPFKSTYAGYGIGDTGDIISLDSMFVTIA